MGVRAVLSGMSHDSDTQDDAMKDVSVRFPEAFLKNEVLPLYPAATSVPEAIRMAVQSDVERKSQAVTPASIRDSVVEALEQAGGSWETNQKLEINAVEDLEISSADSVNVQED